MMHTAFMQGHRSGLDLMKILEDNLYPDGRPELKMAWADGYNDARQTGRRGKTDGSATV